MNKIVIFSLLLLTNPIFQSCFGQKKIDVTYVANAGFLIENSGKKIIIDGLFKNGWGNYLVPADSVISKIIKQQGPFSKANLMLITHNHEDHFNDSMIVAYLNNNSENVLIAPPLVTDAILKNSGYMHKNKIVELDKTNTDKNDIIINGIHIKSFFIQHDARPQIENVGYLIDFGNAKVFHTGDFNGEEASEFGKLQLQKEQIDLALLNFYGFWSTKDERKFTEEYINPKRITLMHIPPAEIEKIKDSLKQVNDFINITVFESSMQKKTFEIKYDI